MTVIKSLIYNIIIKNIKLMLNMCELGEFNGILLKRCAFSNNTFTMAFSFHSCTY